MCCSNRSRKSIDFAACNHGYIPSRTFELIKDLRKQIDYRAFLNKLWEAMPVDGFLQMASDPHVLGNPKVKTQHLIGAQKWKKVSDDEMIAYHQMRVAHQKYSDDKFTEVAVKGHAHGKCTTWFRKIDGEWKWAGLEPDIRWSEYDHDKIFADGEEKFGEKEAF